MSHTPSPSNVPCSWPVPTPHPPAGTCHAAPSRSASTCHTSTPRHPGTGRHHGWGRCGLCRRALGTAAAMAAAAAEMGPWARDPTTDAAGRGQGCRGYRGCPRHRRHRHRRRRRRRQPCRWCPPRSSRHPPRASSYYHRLRGRPPPHLPHRHRRCRRRRGHRAPGRAAPREAPQTPPPQRPRRPRAASNSRGASTPPATPARDPTGP